MAEYSLRPIRPAEAEAFSTWRYDPPFDWYEPGPAELYVRFDAQTFEGYLALVDAADNPVGFVCLGGEARVAGQHEENEFADAGVGIDPSITSNGVATRAMPIVLELLAAELGSRRLRAAIWAKNDRAISTAKRAGFTLHRAFEGPAGRPFVELVRLAVGSPESNSIAPAFRR